MGGFLNAKCLARRYFQYKLDPTLFSTKKEKDNLFPKKALLYNEGRE